jgi:autotransporter-associated beta strand protein
MRLTNTNTFSGTTTISGGTLLVNGSYTGSTLLAGGTLGGTGTVGTIGTATSGTVAPGQSPGILSSGLVNWNPNTTFAVELNGPMLGTQYDQLNVAGTVNLANATLNVALGFTPVLGTLFTIVNNDGNDAITGTFAGLAEGGIVTVNNVPLQVSYTGGVGGNSVTLASLATASPTSTSSTPRAGSSAGARMTGSNVTRSTLVTGPPRR